MQSISIKHRAGLAPSEASAVDMPTVEYPHIAKPLLLLFCGYVVIWYLQVGVRIPALGSIRFEFIYAAVLAVLAFLFTPKIDTKCSLLPYVFLYFIAVAIQVPFSYDFTTSWDVFIDRIVKFAFMAFFIVTFVRSPTHLKFFLGAFLLACLKMGQEGLVGHFWGGMIWEDQGIMRLHGSTPNYGHPNSIAGMAIGTLPFVYFLWHLCNKYCKAILLAIAGLSLHIILYSGSRTAYVGIMAFLVYAYYVSRNKKKFVLYGVLAAVLLMPVIPADYYERFQSIFTHKEKEGQSTEARIEILKDAWEIFKEHPLGVGIAAFPKVRKERFGRTQDTHNLYFEIATNLGIQGLVIVGLLLFKMIGVLHQIRIGAGRLKSLIGDRSTTSNSIWNDLDLIESVALATLSFLIIRLTLGLFGMDLYEIYWWFAIGISLALFSMLNRLETTLGDQL